MVRCGSIIGNRVNADMEEAAAMVDPDFMLNVLINEEGRIGYAVAGHYQQAHEAGKLYLEKTARITIDRKVPFVVMSAGGYPKDIDFYQSTKALSSAREAVAEKGIILFLCQCVDGVGHTEVSSLLQDFPTHRSREIEMRRAFTVSKFAGFLASQMAQDYQIYCVTDLDSAVLEGIGFRVFRHVDEAMTAIEDQFGKGLETYVIPSASSILPGVVLPAKPKRAEKINCNFK